MDQSERIAAMAEAAGLDKEQAAKVLSDFKALITEALRARERVELQGFGFFSAVHEPGGVKKDTKTGQQLHVNPHYVAHFKPGKELRDAVQ